MEKEYREEDYLQLSGIQHFLYCRRQWALIHIEQQWSENGLTTDGKLFHQRVHDENAIELRGDTLSVRGMRISSCHLGITGCCDLVEFHRVKEKGISLQGYLGQWSVMPIEYKRGKFDYCEADAAQLCAEALCLEEMLCCEIPCGILFWGEKHRRVKVDLDDALRIRTCNAIDEMHQYYARGYTPKAVKRPGCDNCSLVNICLPELNDTCSVSDYIREKLEDTH
jgi:CRISPR-associated exonuclease Cas4